MHTCGIRKFVIQFLELYDYVYGINAVPILTSDNLSVMN